MFECLGLVLFDLDVLRRRLPTAAKLTRGVTEFDTFIRNNRKFIPNFGKRYRQSTPLVPPLWNPRLSMS